MRQHAVILGVALSLGVFSGRPACAVLGESIAAPPRAAVALGPYTLTERVADSTVAIREYADTAGVVFAVAWDGPVRPDLQMLLGRYFGVFATTVANRVKGAGRGDLIVSNNEMLIEMGAHLRSHRGRVVLKRALPEGVSLAEIQ